MQKISNAQEALQFIKFRLSQPEFKYPKSLLDALNTMLWDLNDTLRNPYLCKSDGTIMRVKDLNNNGRGPQITLTEEEGEELLEKELETFSLVGVCYPSFWKMVASRENGSMKLDRRVGTAEIRFFVQGVQVILVCKLDAGAKTSEFFIDTMDNKNVIKDNDGCQA
jgi:hypothetical protein